MAESTSWAASLSTVGRCPTSCDSASSSWPTTVCVPATSRGSSASATDASRRYCHGKCVCVFSVFGNFMLLWSSLPTRPSLKEILAVGSRYSYFCRQRVLWVVTFWIYILMGNEFCISPSEEDYRCLECSLGVCPGKESIYASLYGYK